MRDVAPRESSGDDDGGGDYDLAEAPPPVRAPRQPTVVASSVASAPARSSSVAEKYPHRTIKPVAEEPETAHNTSPVRNFVVPIILLSLGVGLRVAQLMYANEGLGNRWAGNLATPGGVGKAFLLVSFEMLVASAIMGIGAVLAAMMMSVEFGPVPRAALKLCASAVFAIGVASWIALFDQDAYSVTGLVLALHVMVVLNWVTLGYFFKIELQELLLTVAIVTAFHAMAIAALWRA
jgi:hypothetical protein